MSEQNSSTDRVSYWKDRAERVGLVSPAKRAMDRGDLPYFKFNRWKYVADSDWNRWLASHRVDRRSPGNVGTLP